MSELTVEKIMNGKDGIEHNSGMFVTGSECYLHQEIIDFLLGEIERIEKQTAEKCIKLTQDVVGNGTDFIEDVIAEDIRKRFDLPPPPE